MDINNFKHVVGQAKQDEPAIIRFFDGVDYWSVESFKEEFLFLQDHVKPSKIIIMINSEGGSVMYGMTIFSLIQACPIETDCVIEGIAASMGSVIWAAGDNLFMHDYSLLMIHNPFSCNCEENMDDNTKQTVDAFKHQLATIYRKRFGMTKEQVESIMNGEGDADGTFFTAQSAVEAGFIDKDHVLKTSKVVRDKVRSQIDGVKNKVDLRNIMSGICAELDENKLAKVVSAIHKQNDTTIINQPKVKEMNENETFGAISALLGLSTDVQMPGISARISELVKAEGEMKAIQSKYTELEIQFKGKEAEIANLSTELDSVKAELKEYQDAESKAFEAKIEATINAAINAGKIENSAKEAWMKMANADFATVEATLASIPARENIGATIANDPENVAKTEEALKDAEAKMQEKVAKVLGKKVEFGKF